MVMTDAQKINLAKANIAKATAKMLFSSMAGMPQEIRLEATLILVKSLFMESVKSEHRMRLFSSVMQKMRAEIREHIKTGVVK